jgi:hypothetical protein
MADSNTNRPSEQTPLIQQQQQQQQVARKTIVVSKNINDSNDDDDDDVDEDDDYFDGTEVFESLKEIDSERRVRRESLAADRLSMRLLAIADDDEELQDQVLKETLNLDLSTEESTTTPSTGMEPMGFGSSRRRSQIEIQKTTRKAGGRFCTMTGLYCGTLDRSRVYWSSQSTSGTI